VKPEDRFVEKLCALLPGTDAILVGPGDDAAILDREAGLLAATTDMLVEGVDFFPGEDPERLGRRAAAVNLSDLAAVGAQPEFFLLSIGFPAGKGQDFPLAIARGAVARASEFGAHLIGGDLSAAPQTIVCVAFWGRPSGPPLRRAGACPGDDVYVSGHPGQAAAGLRLARRISAFAAQGSAPMPRFPEISREDQELLLDAFHDPAPRVRLGMALARERLATAAIDVSDGLGVDAGRLARASGVRVVLEKSRLPVSLSLVSFAAMEKLDPVDLALAGGDDYELLFTAPERESARLSEHAGDFGVPVSRIGRVEEGEGAALQEPQGQRSIADLGHDHFETAR
jgi:thiamine-monophosphate kinase